MTVTTGNMKYWSGNVISENHQRPPYLKLSKGNIAIPRNPKNILKNIGNYKQKVDYCLKIIFWIDCKLLELLVISYPSMGLLDLFS